MRRNLSPSHLPSFLLPCPHCGERMAVMTVVPTPDDAAAVANLEDVTHCCVQCGTTLSRMVGHVSVLAKPRDSSDSPW